MTNSIVYQTVPTAAPARSKQLISALAGTAAAFALSALLHFVWDWSGRFLPAAIFAAVNESVWEHIKIMAWSYLAWSFAAQSIMKTNARRLLIGRTLGVLTVMIGVVCGFYIYSGILGSSVIWVDIASTAVWLLAGEIVCLRIINAPKKIDEVYPLALAVLVLVVVMLLCFTVSAPRLGLFRDPASGVYGIGAFTA